MTVTSMPTSKTESTSLDLQTIVQQAVDKAVSSLTNRIQELEQKVQEQEQQLQTLMPKTKAVKVKEPTIKELKVQAQNLGVTERDVKDQGSRTKKLSWIKAIELKLHHMELDRQEQEQEQKSVKEVEVKVDKFNASNPYSIEGLEMLYKLNADAKPVTGLVVNPF